MKQYIKYFMIFCGLLLIGVSFFIDSTPPVPKIVKNKTTDADKGKFEDAEVVEDKKEAE